LEEVAAGLIKTLTAEAQIPYAIAWSTLLGHRGKPERRKNIWELMAGSVLK
jgi:hypothetical protein